MVQEKALQALRAENERLGLYKDAYETNTTKPVVTFIGEAVFDSKMYEGHIVAHVRTLDHPTWGNDMVRTSSVLKKFDDGSFETLNTIYKPQKEVYSG